MHVSLPAVTSTRAFTNDHLVDLLIVTVFLNLPPLCTPPPHPHPHTPSFLRKFPRSGGNVNGMRRS